MKIKNLEIGDILYFRDLKSDLIFKDEVKEKDVIKEKELLFNNWPIEEEDLEKEVFISCNCLISGNKELLYKN